MARDKWMSASLWKGPREGKLTILETWSWNPGTTEKNCFGQNTSGKLRYFSGAEQCRRDRVVLCKAQELNPNHLKGRKARQRAFLGWVSSPSWNMPLKTRTMIDYTHIAKQKTTVNLNESLSWWHEKPLPRHQVSQNPHVCLPGQAWILILF